MVQTMRLTNGKRSEAPTYLPLGKMSLLEVLLLAAALGRWTRLEKCKNGYSKHIHGKYRKKKEERGSRDVQLEAGWFADKSHDVGGS